VARRLSPYATLSFVVVLGALAVAWASLGQRSRQAPHPLIRGAQSSPFSSVPFTADVTIAKPSGGTYHGKMYAGDHASRTDVDLQPGRVASVIVRYDKKVTWVLMPARHYLESPISENTGLIGLLRNRQAELQRKDLGPEQVGAYPCEKYSITATVQGRRRSGTIWVARAPDLHGFIVKARKGEKNDTITFSHIRLGAPNPSVFEIPAGYFKLPSPSSSHRKPK
jgi:hypothetical protein